MSSFTITIDQLGEFEKFCERLYAATDPAERSQAEETQRQFQNDSNFLKNCTLIFQDSSNPYAQLLAANTLTQRFSASWNVEINKGVELRGLLLAFLANRIGSIEMFVASSVIALICRMTKLGWYQSMYYRDFKTEIIEFMKVSESNNILGFRILVQLVEEMGTHLSGTTSVQHRHVSSSFVNMSLFAVLEVSIQTLQRCSSEPCSPQITDQALKLFVACLNFPFLTTDREESYDDVNTIAAPSTWKNTITDTALLALFAQLYKSAHPPLSVQALDCLCLLAALRRSVFNATSREQYLTALLAIVCDVLTNQTGLSHHVNFHVFCRLVARVKGTFQLTEMVGVPQYPQCVGLISEFTVKSLYAWKWASTSVQYLMLLWARFVTSIRYLPEDQSSHLDEYIPQITEAFIMSRIDSVRVCMADTDIDDPLEDEDQLAEQVKYVSALCNFQFEKMAGKIISLADDVYARLVVPGCSEQSVREGELAWLMHFMAALVQRTHSQSSECHALDAEMCGRALLMMRYCDALPPQVKREEGSPLYYLEVSILAFMTAFFKGYLAESDGISNREIFSAMAPKFSVENEAAMLAGFVQKILANLRSWQHCLALISKSLALFNELSSTFYTARMIPEQEIVKDVLRHHTADHFSFLSYPAHSRARTTFYSTLSHVLFFDDDSTQYYDVFISLFAPCLASLAPLCTSACSEQCDSLKSTFIGLVRDLTGIAEGATSKRAFTVLFEWLHPSVIEIVKHGARLWGSNADVMVPLLRFVSEISHNKCHRLSFTCNSPNGILMFRHLSSTLLAFGASLLAAPLPPLDRMYAMRYKPIALALLALAYGMGGNYVNFGVFALYGDPALSDALSVMFGLVGTISLEDLVAYPKLASAYFSFADVLCHLHMPSVFDLNTQTIGYLVNSFYAGLQASDSTVSSVAATALDNFVTHCCTPLSSTTSTSSSSSAAVSSAIANLISEWPGLFASGQAVLFSLALCPGCTDVWLLSRPLLGLILLDQAGFQSIQQRIICAQPPEKQQAVQEAFSMLLAQLSPTMDAGNRDHFSENLFAFQHELAVLDVTFRGV